MREFGRNCWFVFCTLLGTACSLGFPTLVLSWIV